MATVRYCPLVSMYQADLGLSVNTEWVNFKGMPFPVELVQIGC